MAYNLLINGICWGYSPLRKWHLDENVLYLPRVNYPLKTNMTMGHSPFEDVFPIEHGDFPTSHVSFQGCNSSGTFLTFFLFFGGGAEM